jgi:hypothetical protein
MKQKGKRENFTESISFDSEVSNVKVRQEKDGKISENEEQNEVYTSFLPKSQFNGL